MAKDKKGNGKFKTWWTGLKSEFSKIIWLNRKTVIKQTIIVLIVTAILGVLITVIDFYCQLGLEKIVHKAMKQDTNTEQKGSAPSQGQNDSGSNAGQNGSASGQGQNNSNANAKTEKGSQKDNKKGSKSSSKSNKDSKSKGSKK